MNKLRLFFRGTCLDVEYVFEGVVKQRRVMLVESYEKVEWNPDGKLDEVFGIP